MVRLLIPHAEIQEFFGPAGEYVNEFEEKHRLCFRIFQWFNKDGTVGKLPSLVECWGTPPNIAEGVNNIRGRIGEDRVSFLIPEKKLCLVDLQRIELGSGCQTSLSLLTAIDKPIPFYPLNFRGTDPEVSQGIQILIAQICAEGVVNQNKGGSGVGVVGGHLANNQHQQQIQQQIQQNHNNNSTNLAAPVVDNINFMNNTSNLININNQQQQINQQQQDFTQPAAPTTAVVGVVAQQQQVVSDELSSGNTSNGDQQQQPQQQQLLVGGAGAMPIPTTTDINNNTLTTATPNQNPNQQQQPVPPQQQLYQQQPQQPQTIAAVAPTSEVIISNSKLPAAGADPFVVVPKGSESTLIGA